MTPVEHPYWVWTLFFAVVLIALFVDIGIVNRKAHIPSRKETFSWAIVWVSLAIGFNIFLYFQVGNHYQAELGYDKAWALALDQGKLFLTGYLIELSLSVDNLFVFLLIFSYFKVPKQFQHRVLFWGIMGALIMRMIMIFAGAELIERFHWIIYLFGFFLLYTGIKMFKDNDEDFDPTESGIVKLTTRYIRISKEYNGDKFFVVKNGVRSGTLLLLVLIVVEFTDLVFAVDSIPAIFGITTDRFIVYTSNIFAILGLRTFFFLLADIADRFHYLKTGLAFILTFIGLKMLLPLIAEGVIMITDTQTGIGALAQRLLDGEFKQQIVNISLAVVVGAITLSIVASLIFPTKAAHASLPESNEDDEPDVH